MKIKIKEFNKIANIYPLMKDNTKEKELWEQFKNDIKDKGLVNPIVLLDDKILDGRNRAIACEEVGVDPIYEIFKGTESEALDYVISNNSLRRHLSSGQRAALAIDNEELFNKIREESKSRQVRKPVNSVVQKIAQQNIRTCENLAKKFDTNKQYINDAKKLQEEDADLKT